MFKRNAGIVATVISSFFAAMVLSGCEGCSSSRPVNHSYQDEPKREYRPGEPGLTPHPSPMGPTQEDINRAGPQGARY
jgi:hypothetical protein